MTLASKLPAYMLDSLSSVQGFINSKVTPALSFSGGLVSSSAALLGQPKAAGSEPSVGSVEDAAEKYGVDVETAKLVRAAAVKFAQAEETTAPNEEAKLCLRKGGEGDWGAVADYRACVRAIAEGERGGAAAAAGKARLRVLGCFAASDAMIGKGGQGYFEECWRQEDVAGCVDFETRTYEGTNHDSVLVDSRRGGMRDCLLKAAEGKLERAT